MAGREVTARRSLAPPVGGLGLPKIHRSFVRSGFTLLEIMIAIGIAAIIMATGIPAFVRAMQKEGLRKGVSDLVEGCSHARAWAILRGIPTELVIRAENGQITVQPAHVNERDEFAGVASAANDAPAPAAMPAYSGQLPDHVAVRLVAVNFQEQMDQPEVRVRFFPNGTSDEFTIILTSAKGERKISLDVITGLADVEVIR